MTSLTRRYWISKSNDCVYFHDIVCDRVQTLTLELEPLSRTKISTALTVTALRLSKRFSVALRYLLTLLQGIVAGA